MARTKQTFQSSSTASKSPRGKTGKVIRKIAGNSSGKRKSAAPQKRKVSQSTLATKEIQKYQGYRKFWKKKDKYGLPRYTDVFYETATEFLIPKAAFQRLVKDVIMDYNIFDIDNVRITVQALQALQTAAEDHLVSVFRDANLFAVNANRETLRVRDMRFAGRIRNDPLPPRPHSSTRKQLYMLHGLPPNYTNWFDDNKGCFARTRMEGNVPADLLPPIYNDCHEFRSINGRKWKYELSDSESDDEE